MFFITLSKVIPQFALGSRRISENGAVEGTGTRPDYLINRDDQKNEGLFGENNCTEIEK